MMVGVSSPRHYPETVMQEFLKIATAGYNPIEDNRVSDLPVGLRVRVQNKRLVSPHQ